MFEHHLITSISIHLYLWDTLFSSAPSCVVCKGQEGSNSQKSRRLFFLFLGDHDEGLSRWPGSARLSASQRRSVMHSLSSKSGVALCAAALSHRERANRLRGSVGGQQSRNSSEAGFPSRFLLAIHCDQWSVISDQEVPGL